MPPVPTGYRKKGSRVEIYDKATGRHVGWSDSKKKAAISASYRDRGHKGWKTRRLTKPKT